MVFHRTLPAARSKRFPARARRNCLRLMAKYPDIAEALKTFRAGDSSGDIHHRRAFWRLGAPSQVSHTASATAVRGSLLSSRTVFAGRRIDAVGSQHQSFHGFAAHDVRVDDFVNVRFGHASVPDGLRVDHDIRSVLALIKTAGLVGPDPSLKSAFRQLLLEQLLQLGVTRGIATPPRMPKRSLVPANKYVMFELRHGSRDALVNFSTLLCLSS